MGRRARLARAAPAAAFLAAVFVLIGPSLVGVRVVLPHDLLDERLPWAEVADAQVTPANVELRDVVDTYYPVQHAILRDLRAGRRTAWLHDLSLGVPGSRFVGWGALSPFNLPALVAPFDLAWSWAMGLRLLTAMAGAYVLARSVGAGRIGGTVAGLAFGLSGFMVGWLGWPQSHVGAFVPWVLWAARLAAGRSPPWWAGPVLAAATAGLWLGGFPAVAVYALLAAGGVAVHAAWRRRADGWTAIAGLGIAAAGVVVGTALVAFTLLPTVAFLGELDLGYRQDAWRLRVPARALVTFAVPAFFGNLVDFPVWLGFPYIEAIGYVGVTTLVLAAAAWVVVPRSRGLGLFTVLAVVILGLVYGIPYLREPLGWLPLLRSNAPTRALVLVGLSLAVAGGLGADGFVRLARGQARIDRRAAGAVGALLLAGAAAVALLVLTGELRQLADRFPPPDTVRRAFEVAAAETAVAGAFVLVLAGVVAASLLAVRRWPSRASAAMTIGLVLVVGVDLLRFAAGWNVQVPRAELFPDAPGITELREFSDQHRVAAADRVGHPNTHLEYGFRDVRAHTFVTPRLRRVLDRLDARWMSPTFWDLRAAGSGRWQPWLSLLGVRAVLLDDTVDALGGIVLQARADEDFGPLTAGRDVGMEAGAPRAGEIVGAKIRVGTYVRQNDGDLVLTIAAGNGAATGSVPAADLLDLRWVTVPLPPLKVHEGEPLRIAIAGTAEDPDRAATVLGGSAGPAVALLYRDAALSARPLAGSQRLQLLDSPDALPLVFAVSEARAVTPGQAVDAVGDLGAAALSQVALVEPPRGETLPPLPDGGAARLERWERGGGEVTATVTSEDGALLVALDQALPGWSAAVDGEPAPVLIANHLYVAVVVPPGTSDVRLRYDPPGGRAGAAVSLVALALVAVWTALAWRRRDEPAS